MNLAYTSPVPGGPLDPPPNCLLLHYTPIQQGRQGVSTRPVIDKGCYVLPKHADDLGYRWPEQAVAVLYPKGLAYEDLALVVMTQEHLELVKTRYDEILLRR